MLSRCNETQLLSDGDNGYLIVRDDGKQDIYCGVTIKTEVEGSLLSMRFLVRYLKLLANKVLKTGQYAENRRQS